MHSALFLLALLAPAMGRMLPHAVTRSMFRMDDAPFIVGGDDAEEGAWPWQGYLLSFGSFSCGLTVISEEWVMTAAHCIFGSSPGSITVGVGCTNRNGDCQEFDVDEVIWNTDFNWNPPDGDDVGVMHLTEALTFDDLVAAVTISTEEDISEWADNTDCYITGWGRTTGGGALPNIMQQANIDVYTIEECEALWGPGDIEDNEHVCVGITNQSGSCNGDSGGPAVCGDGEGNYVQIGITSWGATGCNTALPSVYTNAAYFLGWIRENCGDCV